MTTEISDEPAAGRYFSALLAVGIIGLATVGTMMLIVIELFSFTRFPRYLDLDLIIRRGLPMLRDYVLFNGAGLTSLLVTLPLVRVLQPQRRHYWLLILLCLAANPIMLTLMTFIFVGASNTILLAMSAGLLMVMAGVFGVLFLPLQRTLEWIFGLLRRRGRRKAIAQFFGGRVFAVYASTAIIALLVPIAAYIAIVLVLIFRSSGLYPADIALLFSAAGTELLSFISMNVVGICAALLILPPIRLFLPKLRFTNLILALCFALGPLAHSLAFYLAPQTDPLAGEDLFYVLMMTGATIPVALVCGLFQRGIEGRILGWQAGVGLRRM